MASINYAKLKATVKGVIRDLGENRKCTVTHLAGGTSSGLIIFPNTIQTDASIPDVGTVAATERTAFIEAITTEVCVGDTVTVGTNTYRVREVVKYDPAGINVAWRVVLDA